MSVVFESMPLCPAGRKWQHGIFPVQSLNGRLFVHTEYSRMDRRIDVQTDDVGSFGFEVRVICRHIPLHAVRLQVRPAPNSRHHHMGYSKMLSRFPRGPVGRSISRILLRCRQNPGLQFNRLLSSLAALVPAIESSEPLRLKPRFPACYISCITRQCALNLNPSVAFGKHQNQPRPSLVSSTYTLRPRAPTKFPLFFDG